MKAVIVVFPGSNCDRDVMVALEASAGRAPAMVWHDEQALPACDLIVLPGGFAHGDYLRAGAMAARSPVMADVVKRPTPACLFGNLQRLPGGDRGRAAAGCADAERGAALRLPLGQLARGRGREPVYRRLPGRAGGTDAGRPSRRQLLRRCGDAGPARGRGAGRLRYVGNNGEAAGDANPNGSAADIAGILNPARTVLGLMPHPERAAEPALGGADGRAMFDRLVEALS